jgi:hypothetical protein
MAFIRQQASLAHEYKTNITCFWSIANWGFAPEIEE